MATSPETLPRFPDYAKTRPDECEIHEMPDVECVSGASPLWMGTLRQAYLLGAFGLIVSRDRSVLLESTNYNNIEVVIESASHSLSDPVVVKAGEYVALHGIWSTTFWHWVMEYLPKVVLAERAGFQGKYLISRDAPPFVLESLLLLGVLPGRIEEWDGANWQVEKLWLGPRLRGEDLMQYPGAIRLLREALLKGGGETPESSLERVYITRRKARNGRRVINEAELIAFLENRGFTTVDMDGRTLADQIAVMRSVRFLVAPHGAGLVHALFMPEQSSVIELFSPAYVNPCVMPIVRCLRHRYNMIVSFNPLGQYPHGTDVEAFMKILEWQVECELERLSGVI